jgi:predicted DNA binding CopG/RHH family protein
MSEKKAINVWLSHDEYTWLKRFAAEQGMTMTSVLRDLIQKRKADYEHARKPSQF